jgi:hypothetical protein
MRAYWLSLACGQPNRCGTWSCWFVDETAKENVHGH